jgi:hypothetical protein
MSSLQREINNPDVIIEDAIDENTKKKLNFGEMSINDTENVNLIKKKIMKTKNIQKYNKIIANFPYVRNLHFLLDIYYVENMDLSADLYSLEPFWRFMNPFMEVFDHPKKGNLEKVLFFQYLHNTFVDHNIGSCFGIVEQLTYNHYKNETTNKITLEDSQGNKITWDKEMFLYVINGKWYIKEIVYKIFKYLDKMEKLSSIVTERDIITRAKDKEPRKYKIRDDCFYLNGKGFRSSKRNNYNRISIRNDLKPEMIIEKEEIYEVKNEHKDEFQKIFNNPLTEFIHKLSFFNDSNFMLRLLPRSWEGTKLIHKLELTSEEWKIINAIIKEQFLWMGHPELTCNFGPNEAPSDTKWIFGNNINLKSKSFIPKGDINNIINKKEAINEAIKNGFAE